MLKWIGIIMIIFGTTMTGYDLYIERKKSKMKTEKFIKVLLFMRDEMRYSKAYIENVFLRCADVDIQTEAFFLHISEALKAGETLEKVWRAEVNETEYLCTEAQKALLDLADVLGTVDMEVQSAHIERCICDLEAVLKKQTEEFNKKGTLSLKIGVLSGVIISILLF